MTKGRTGWRKAGAAAVLACALLLPTSVAYAQAPTPTRPAVTTSPAAGEPAQDMLLIAAVLGAMVAGGVALQRFAARRA
jgi:hypothetical protein